MTNIAIIGAGLSGLTLAHTLKDYANVTLFEKSRGVGGRMATRRAAPFEFDHGAPFFRVKTNAFHTFIAPMITAGIVQRWDARFAEFEHKRIVNSRVWGSKPAHYVGAPSMNAIAKWLAQNVDVRLNTKVVNLQRHDAWDVIDEHDAHIGTFDWVISTAPSQQTIKLLPSSFQNYHNLASTKMSGCFSLMLGFTDKLAVNFDAALVRDADISWISVNSSKPGRSSPFCLVVHATNQWADKHIDDDKHKVMQHLCDETSEIIGHDVSIAQHKSVHAWRFANIEKQNKPPLYIDTDLQLAACGDWCTQGIVEGAFTSACHLAKAVSAVI